MSKNKDGRAKNGGARPGAGRNTVDRPKLSKNWRYDQDVLEKAQRISKNNGGVPLIRVFEFAVEQLNESKVKIAKKKS